MSFIHDQCLSGGIRNNLTVWYVFYLFLNSQNHKSGILCSLSKCLWGVDLNAVCSLAFMYLPCFYPTVSLLPFSCLLKSFLPFSCLPWNLKEKSPQWNSVLRFGDHFFMAFIIVLYHLNLHFLLLQDWVVCP